MINPGVQYENVKPKGIISAESAVQQSPGRKPWERQDDKMKPCKGDAVCAAHTGLLPLDCISQGLRPGLCCLALSGPIFLGAAVSGCSYQGKIALYDGAFDERIARTLPQETSRIVLWRPERVGEL